MPSVKSAQPAPQAPVSAAKLAANRANAQRSTGPRTPAGKARSCSNRFGRGFFVERLLIDTLVRREDPDEFATLHMRWHQTLRPRSEVEYDLVEKICANQLQVQRLTELDGLLLQWYAGERGMEGVAEWFKREASRQAAIASVDRAAQRGLRELAREQAARLGKTPQWTSTLLDPESQFLVTEPPGFVGLGAGIEFPPAAAPAAVSPAAAAPSPARELPEQREGERPLASAPTPDEIPAERLAAMTDAEYHEAASRDVPLPAGYRYTKRGIVHEDDPPPAASPSQALPLPQDREAAGPAATRAPSPAASVPLKVRFPIPYPGQAPWPALGALDPVARYPHLAAVSSGPGAPGRVAGNGSGDGSGDGSGNGSGDGPGDGSGNGSGQPPGLPRREKA